MPEETGESALTVDMQIDIYCNCKNMSASHHAFLTKEPAAGPAKVKVPVGSAPEQAAPAQLAIVASRRKGWRN